MKKIFISLFLVSFSNSYAQIARVVQTEYKSDHFNSGSIAIGTQLHDFHLEVDYSSGSLINIIQHNVFDDYGKVLDMAYIQLPFSMEKTQITGVFLKGASTVIVYTTKHIANTNNVQHDLIEIDINTNAYIQHTELALGAILRNVSPTIEIGNKLVNYVTEHNVGLKRIAVDKSNLSSISSELVEAFSPNPSPYFRRSIGFVVENGHEFVSFMGNQKVHRRLSANNFQSSAVISGLYNLSNTSIAVSLTNIIVTSGSAYVLLDFNFGLQAQSAIIANNPNYFSSCIFKNGHFYVLQMYSPSDMVLEKFTVSMAQVEKIFEEDLINKCDLRIVNNKIAFSSTTNADYFSSLNEDGTDKQFSSPNSHFTVTLLIDENQPFSGFLDTGYELEAKDFILNSGPAHTITINSGLNPNYGTYGNNTSKSPLIYTASNVFLGIDDSDTVGTFNRFYNNSYLVGPYTNPVDYDWKLQSNYSRRYHLTKYSISNHLQNLANNTPNYIPEFAIREWPGNGDVSKGQAFKLADFHDVNNDGVYNPLEGDYPIIYGDECVFAISYTSSGTASSPNIELHSYRFRFWCDENDVVTNVIFQKNLYIARGPNIDSVYLSNFFDFDLGNPQDDYIGTNVELGLVYSYNGDTLDESYSYSAGWGNAPPTFGVMTLQGVKQLNDGIDNSFGVGINESINGTGFGDGINDNEYLGLTSSFFSTNMSSFPLVDPVNVNQFYQIGAGNNVDGSPQTFQLHPNSLGIPIRHAMFGNSDPLFYSSGGFNHGNNISENGINGAGDRRIISSSGPGKLNSGDTISSLIALLYSRDSIATSVLAPVNKLFADAAQLKALYANNNVGCGVNFDPVQVFLDVDQNILDLIKIYPNPTYNKFFISNLEVNSELVLSDLDGKVLMRKKLTEANTEIDLSACSSGLYFVQISNSAGSVLRKVVKN